MRYVERAVSGSRSAATSSRYQSSAFDLDLSAFEPRADLASSQERRQLGAATNMQPRKLVERLIRRDEGASKRSLQRQAERAAERRGVTPAATPKQALRPKQVQSARTEHLHAPHSPQERKEKSRDTCKERPEPVKAKGKGGSRPFVPWCSRRR